MSEVRQSARANHRQDHETRLPLSNRTVPRCVLSLSPSSQWLRNATLCLDSLRLSARYYSRFNTPQCMPIPAPVLFIHRVLLAHVCHDSLYTLAVRICVEYGFSMNLSHIAMLQLRLACIICRASSTATLFWCRAVIMWLCIMCGP